MDHYSHSTRGGHGRFAAGFWQLWVRHTEFAAYKGRYFQFGAGEWTITGGRVRMQHGEVFVSKLSMGGTVMSTGHLARNPNDKWIAGVCGGIARWLGWSSDAVRLLYVLISVFSAAFPGLLVYIVLWIAMPVEE